MRALAALAILLFSSGAFAQEFPAKPVRLVLPVPPGGAMDIVARTLVDRWSQNLGQPVVLDYKAGAGGMISTEFVAKAAPDGYTTGLVSTAHVINPGLKKQLPYDTVRDLSGVSLVAVSHILIAATPSLPANNMAELIALARKSPGRISFATPGPGGAMHLSGELLKYMTGIDIVHVPYKGGPSAYPDVIAGRIELMIDPVYSLWPQVRSGKMKVIGMASPSRPASYPDVPAIAETVPGYSVESITGIIVSSRTPRPYINRLAADIGRALEGTELRTRMTDAGMEPAGSTPEQYDARIRAEIEKWSKVIQAAGIKPE
jgi:tripartite-type tricarboxylate transporter receptor subunit TctC